MDDDGYESSGQSDREDNNNYVWDDTEGKWIGGEFYSKKATTGKRRGSFQTRSEERIYGVFSHNSGEEDNDEPKSRGNKKGKVGSRGILISAPVMFVAKKTEGNNEKVKEEKETFDSDLDTLDSEKEDDLNTDNAFKEILSSVSITAKYPSNNNILSKSNNDFRKMYETEEIISNITEEISSSNSNVPQQRQPSVIKVVPPEVSIKGLGTWEKHTKGIGMKLLQKYGFKGRLGANEDGISQAIEVQIRPHGIGLGFGESASKEVVNIASTETSNRDTSHIEKIAKSSSWKKSSSSGKRKVRNEMVALSVDRVLSDMADGSSSSVQVHKQVIIDMRGPGRKIIADASLISEVQTSIGIEQPLLGQELLHNMSLISNIVEEEVQSSSRRLLQEVNRRDKVQRDIDIVGNEEHSNSNVIENIEEIISILDKVMARIDEDSRTVTVSVTGICHLFKTLFLNYRNEFKMFGLINVFPSLSMSILKQQVIHWKPLTKATKYDGTHVHVLTELCESWLPLSGVFKQAGEDVLSDQFHEIMQQMVDMAIMPAVRKAVVNDWDVQTDYQSCITLITTLKTFLPKVSYEQVLTSLILPKLLSTVDTWVPTLAPSVLIHTWLHPWIPHLGSRLSACYPDIRRKFSKVLGSWQVQTQAPSSPLALDMLAPWMGIFDQTSMDTLTVKCILPKLSQALRTLTINPQHQDLTIFHAVICWRTIIPIHHLVCLFLGEFFPRWLTVLSDWLTVLSPSGPDFSEVSQWYLGWKSLFPDVLQQEEGIVKAFSIALDMMQLVLSGETGDQTVAAAIRDVVHTYKSQHTSYFDVVHKKTMQKTVQTRIAELQPQHVNTNNIQGNGHGHVSIKFRDVVEMFAETHGVEFVPRAGKMYQGKQVWSFGKCVCYIDRDVMFLHKSSSTNELTLTWVPISLDDLLSIAKS